MQNLLRFIAIGMATSTLGLTGCNQSQHPAYSPSMKYPLRNDPILTGTATQLGEERYDPDRPGVFPLAKLEDVFDADHPYYVKLKEKLAGPLNKLINDDKLPEEQRKRLQDKLMQDPKNRKSLTKELDSIFRNPAALGDKDRKELEAAMEKAFGTPAAPLVNAAELGLKPETIETLKLDKETLAKGSTYYRIHCLHCHGVTGDGRGPTARWINPHPRDFRAGKFKFTSVFQVGTARPPSRKDLLQTLRHGLEGTAMPSFNLLPADELEAIASYVIHLSIRGKVEQDALRAYEYKDDVLVLDPQEDVKDNVQTIAKRITEKSADSSWLASQDAANWIKVELYPYKDGDMDALKASVKRGKEMFTAKPSPEFIKEYSTRLPDAVKQAIRTAVEAKKLSPKEEADELVKQSLEKAENTLKAPNCVSCHVDYGRQAKFRFDDWGTLVRPNNFTNGVFRGGRRPVDIYYRVHSGISPSGMTNFGGVLQGQDIWDLVNFVSSVSFPTMRKTLELNIN